MTIRYFVQRPELMPVVQWAGDNLAEVQSAFPSVRFTAQADGSLLYGGGALVAPTTVPNGWYLAQLPGSQSVVASQADPGADAAVQEVGSAGPFDYTVTAVTA